MTKGEIVEQGSHEQLIERENGLYRRLFTRQAIELAKGMLDDGSRADSTAPQDADAAIDEASATPPVDYAGDPSTTHRLGPISANR